MNYCTVTLWYLSVLAPETLPEEAEQVGSKNSALEEHMNDLESSKEEEGECEKVESMPASGHPCRSYQNMDKCLLFSHPVLWEE